jgi:hypothetical protein
METTRTTVLPMLTDEEWEAYRKEQKEAARTKKEAAKQKKKQEQEYWAEQRARSQVLADQSLALFQTFHEVTTAYFTEEVAGQTFERKPHISITLVTLGEPRAKIAIRPCWQTTYGEKKTLSLLPDRVHIELLVERLEWKNSEQIVATHKDLELVLYKTKVSMGRYYPNRVEECIGRVVETMTAFMIDPEPVLARSCDHCCVCGRGLTDETSRSRGIGPECLKKWGNIRDVLDRLARPR